MALSISRKACIARPWREPRIGLIPNCSNSPASHAPSLLALIIADVFRSGANRRKNSAPTNKRLCQRIQTAGCNDSPIKACSSARTCRRKVRAQRRIATPSTPSTQRCCHCSFFGNVAPLDASAASSTFFCSSMQNSKPAILAHSNSRITQIYRLLIEISSRADRPAIDFIP